MKKEQLPDLCIDLVWFNVGSPNTAHWNMILPWLKHLWNFNFYYQDIVNSKKPAILSDEEWNEACLTLYLPERNNFITYQSILNCIRFNWRRRS